MCDARRKPKALAIVRVAVAVLLLAAGGAAVHAQTGGGYDLTWWTVDGGGARLTGGGYVLVGTAGQPDAGALSGGGYTLSGGFWPSAASGARAYLPVVMRTP